MEIEIIRTSATTDRLSTTREFGIILNKVTSIIKMLHWYSKNYNAHIILGDLYEDITDLFDNLQEEIIGTVNGNENCIFPMFNNINIDLNNPEIFNGDRNSYIVYTNTVELVKNILTSMEFKNYISSVKSGIQNTTDDIITRINKTNYLLSLVNI